MPNRLTVTFEGDHVLVHADGDKDMTYATNLWSQVASTCEKYNCFNVLAISRSSTPLEAQDSYEYVRLYRKFGVDDRYRIAWVELEPEASDIASFIETVLAGRGFPDRGFPTEAEARKWLLESEKS